MDSPLVRIDPGLLIWTIITFLALLALLRWKAWGPIVAAIERREKAIKDAIEAAKQEREEATRLLAEHKTMIDQARRETVRLIDQGRKDAEVTRLELIEKARGDAREVLEQGRKQIERETRAAVQQIRTEAANLAVLAAGRIVKVSLDEGAQKRLIDECLKEIGDLPGTGPGQRPS
jgi:F-type H+-transporting ATPase subunit b